MRPCAASFASRGTRRILIGQRRIRFVEQKDLRVAGDRARDLGPLLGRQRTIGQRRVGKTVDAEGVHHFGVGRAPTSAGHGGPVSPDQHLLGDSQVGEELRLLVDDGDRRQSASGDQDGR